MQVVILCGGKGTRIRDVADDIPKPMIPVGRRPILWHLMRCYAQHGFNRFVLCLGYKSWSIKQFFLDYHRMHSDLSLDIHSPESLTVRSSEPMEDWHVTLAETGLDAMTGARLRRVGKYITGEHFLLTYGDGLSDVDIPALVRFHLAQGKIGTVTVVQPPGRFGEVELDGPRVAEFSEKPPQAKGRINGGFFAFRREFLDRLPDREDLVLEQEPLRQLTQDGQLAAYQHDGFWQCMDSSRDFQYLNALWDSGQAPWNRGTNVAPVAKPAVPPAAKPAATAAREADREATPVISLPTAAPAPAPASEFWRDRRVFVTGCTGLVGAWTVRALLERGAHVVGLVRDHVYGSELVRAGLDRRIDVVRGCVEDQSLVERALAEYEVQTVLHLAAQTIVGIANRSPLSTFEANIKGTWCVLEAARRCGHPADVVVASSDKAYGEQAELPYTEETPLEGRHPYDVSKSCTDLLALSYHHTYRLPVCVTRCGNFYGGGDLNWNRIVPGTIRSVLRGEAPVIRSDGTNVRDYFYVKDGAAAYLHLAECMARMPEVAGHAFNFSADNPVSVLDLTHKILRLMGSPLQPRVLGQARNEIKHQYLSSAKAQQMLAWAPRYELDAALRETIAWYKEYLAGADQVRARAA